MMNDENQPDGSAAEPSAPGIKPSATEHDEQNNQYQQ